MNFKYAIFDMDGTLIKSMDYWDKIEKEVIGEMCGIAPDGDFFKNHYQTLEEMLEKAQKSSGITIDKKEAFRKMHFLMKDNYENAPIEQVDCALEFLTMLKEKGIKTAIATATPLEECLPCLKRLGIADIIDKFVSTKDVRKNKFHPDVYLKAIELIGGIKEETVVFEDAFYCLETLKNNNFRYIIVDDGERSRMIPQCIKDSCEQYICSYKELINI